MTINIISNNRTKRITSQRHGNDAGKVYNALVVREGGDGKNKNETLYSSRPDVG